VDRRTFLRRAGGLSAMIGAGGWLAACGDGPDGAAPEVAGGDAATIPSGDATLSVVNASYETLTGEQRRLNLVVTESDNTPIEGAALAVFVRNFDGEVLTGPHPATYYPEEGAGTGSGRGLYQTLVPLPDPGELELVAVEGDRYGTAAIRVRGPADSEAPVPGDEAVSTATPTLAEPLGFAPVCTQEPPCGMHTESLDDLLAGGRPVVMLFATPAYCQTVACAPAVANLEQVRTSGDWGDVAFVHCEIYATPETAGREPSQPVRDWNLPTEPWLFTIGRDGRIVDRLDGPMLPEDMARLAEQLV